MFKRVEKRIRKKEKEEELGLDGDMKEMLGMNDTDSDESSSSDSDEKSEDEGEVDMDNGSHVEEENEGSGEEEEEESEPESDEQEDEEPPMSVSEALQNPLYLVSLEPEVKACIVCPGKLLKNPVMIDVHLKAGAHTRRYARLRESAMDVDADTDVRDLVRAQLANQALKQSNSAEGKLSKRAQKKKAKLAAIKAKRDKQKVMKAKHRAKKEAKLKAASDSKDAVGAQHDAPDEMSPGKPTPAKKRKVQIQQKADSDTDDHAAAPMPVLKRPKVPITSRKSDPPKPSVAVKHAISKPALPSHTSMGKTKSGLKVNAKKRRRSEPS